MSEDTVRRKPVYRPPAEQGQAPHRERGLAVPTTEHPLWPAFKRWADDRLGGGYMLGVYWECWLAGANVATLSSVKVLPRIDQLKSVAAVGELPKAIQPKASA